MNQVSEAELEEEELVEAELEELDEEELVEAELEEEALEEEMLFLFDDLDDGEETRFFFMKFARSCPGRPLMLSAFCWI